MKREIDVTAPSRIHPANPWQVYEDRKRQWAEAHPQATPQEHAAAVRAIAEELGL